MTTTDEQLCVGGREIEDTWKRAGLAVNVLLFSRGGWPKKTAAVCSIRSTGTGTGTEYLVYYLGGGNGTR